MQLKLKNNGRISKNSKVDGKSRVPISGGGRLGDKVKRHREEGRGGRELVVKKDKYSTLVEWRTLYIETVTTKKEEGSDI